MVLLGTDSKIRRAMLSRPLSKMALLSGLRGRESMPPGAVVYLIGRKRQTAATNCP
jgi:hypothetical protein